MFRAEGNIPDRKKKKSQTHTFFKLHTQHVAYSAFSVSASFQTHIQLRANMLSIVSPLKISALITPRFLPSTQKNFVYIYSLCIAIPS